MMGFSMTASFTPSTAAHNYVCNKSLETSNFEFSTVTCPDTYNCGNLSCWKTEINNTVYTPGCAAVDKENLTSDEASTYCNNNCEAECQE